VQTPGIVTAMGYPGESSGDNFGEGTLDTQYVSGIAPGVRTFAYNSNNSASTEVRHFALTMLTRLSFLSALVLPWLTSSVRLAYVRRF
jgi:hypothetical protein